MPRLHVHRSRREGVAPQATASYLLHLCLFVLSAAWDDSSRFSIYAGATKAYRKQTICLKCTTEGRAVAKSGIKLGVQGAALPGDRGRLPKTSPFPFSPDAASRKKDFATALP